jgi:predicted RecA/RadA family phage recombinase
MSTTYRQPGEKITLTAPTGGYPINIAVPVVTGTTGFCAIPIDTIAAGETGPAYVEGVHEVSALTGTAFTNGQLLYWDNTNKRLTNASTGNTRIGRAWGAKASATATHTVKLGAY